MVKVEFLGPLNRDDIYLDISNLLQLSDFLKKDDEILPWLETCAVAVNDTLIYEKNFNLEDGDKISLLPPVCGG